LRPQIGAQPKKCAGKKKGGGGPGGDPHPARVSTPIILLRMGGRLGRAGFVYALIRGKGEGGPPGRLASRGGLGRPGKKYWTLPVVWVGVRGGPDANWARVSPAESAKARRKSGGGLVSATTLCGTDRFWGPPMVASPPQQLRAKISGVEPGGGGGWGGTFGGALTALPSFRGPAGSGLLFGGGPDPPNVAGFNRRGANKIRKGVCRSPCKRGGGVGGGGGG